jgi:hypothetical protein
MHRYLEFASLDDHTLDQFLGCLFQCELAQQDDDKRRLVSSSRSR